MTNPKVTSWDDLKERIDHLDRKLDRTQNIEDRLEKAFRKVTKFRDGMISKGYSYAMVEEFNQAIQPIESHYNELQNRRKKLQKIKEQAEQLRKAEQEKQRRRKAAIVEHVFRKEKEFPYNTDCRNFTFTDGEAICEVKMDLQYCGDRCPYTTTKPCSNKVDAKGRTVAYNRR